ncbi:uncharacterized protein MONOS_11131 [Monocercomonoides exilis]|uniref:uncharacterized protein n=1 Tax=Monocercomonoides exilis TaxID=2049356 RepID=UPI003559567D|nr:hypothetical protein MONOS_11131 [Monocercomonoides exilis]|eukprot:MONOS_11131.1-p1 / transcript=MONOS_11131.1 / gene=MONOS_11131 / organism=Monocercomonoides_exilis_PA203 / gene_product=unspecified product / transcript_product=unspecified product / location=Mono_scaffold00542:4395-5394(+) / protein_length=128 / sequence_SO=supercontig / SO=protein_coding / is_pseudo=false
MVEKLIQFLKEIADTKEMKKMKMKQKKQTMMLEMCAVDAIWNQMWMRWMFGLPKTQLKNDLTLKLMNVDKLLEEEEEDDEDEEEEEEMEEKKGGGGEEELDLFSIDVFEEVADKTCFVGNTIFLPAN